MNKIKLNLYNMTVLDTFTHARRVFTSMTGNANFPSPIPSLAEYQVLLETAEQDSADYELMASSLAEKLTRRDNSVAALDAGTTRLAGYVGSIAGGDEAKILSAGMQPRAGRSPIGKLEEPLSFLAEAGDREGAISLSWAKVRGAHVYEVQVSPEDGKSWKTVTMVTRASATISGLVSGTRLTFRVRAIGTAGPGPWSDPAFKTVP